MNETKQVQVAITKVDSFLDITYYDISYTYWDGDKEVFKNKPHFTTGSVLNEMFEKLDNLNQNIEIRLRLKNFGKTEITIKEIVGKLESKKGKLPLCRELTSTEKDAKKLKENFNQFSIVF